MDDEGLGDPEIVYSFNRLIIFLTPSFSYGSFGFWDFGLFTIYYLLFTIYYLLCIFYLLFIIHYPLSIYYLLFIIYYLSSTPYRLPSTVYHLPSTIYYSFLSYPLPPQVYSKTSNLP